MDVKKCDTIYKGAFYNYKIKHIETRDGVPYSYECVERAFYNPNGGVEVLPILIKDGKRYLVVIRNYRYAVESYVLEFPGGIADGDETIEQASARELKEETGFKLKRIVNVQKSLWVDPWKSNDVGS